jgi:hypothetical protein
MKALIIVGIIVVALAAIGAAVYLLFLKGPDLSGYESLRDPRISPRPRKKMLEVAFQGKPDELLPKAFQLLYKAYYSLPGVPKSKGGSAPIARFKGLAGLPTDLAKRAEALANFSANDWSGVVGLPVPESVTDLPTLGDTSPFTVRLAVWEYGEVAEILHVGSYETELPTIAGLEEYIRAQGYKISGDHEEEYLRGPGMLFTKPESYYTIIRYPVRKAVK